MIIASNVFHNCFYDNVYEMIVDLKDHFNPNYPQDGLKENRDYYEILTSQDFVIYQILASKNIDTRKW